jgi:hypothetical protein
MHTYIQILLFKNKQSLMEEDFSVTHYSGNNGRKKRKRRSKFYLS